jgi:hypothetical protein
MDKAGLGARTEALGYLYRDLLQIPRGDEYAVSGHDDNDFNGSPVAPPKPEVSAEEKKKILIDQGAKFVAQAREEHWMQYIENKTIRLIEEGEFNRAALLEIATTAKQMKADEDSQKSVEGGEKSIMHMGIEGAE